MSVNVLFLIYLLTLLKYFAAIFRRPLERRRH